ncbi:MULTISPECIES: preprotein translocase subunit YajC [Streptomyces]|uniref:Preprotein translocase subunit YajC n=1 Tax=Streptomyces evansiae TaxID=3075535 RepID=A0ABD5E3L3_9ACTN|nr:MULTISPECIES: preprotein translocase subunit YajC [unclassified Streptomyces]MYQ61302.1 preprotein translocase subunit YajC [Streptomyces sp. SID4926]MYR29466.1 preprotein translocase subunit YajC [Streptomyces sp. SID4945]MYX22329.1 preprotein translocase subunit YajC [Streptomyces sp. SID8380]ASY35894.1 preprotein translocase subunit YajC [Streptomyces sp. CLI2509]EFK98699.1 secreted protein [Streptomyces sp. SPB78]
MPSSLVSLLPFVLIIGAMFLMTRSAKRKQQAAANMRSEMQPGSGVRTIGGMYALVKEVGEDTVLLEVAPGVHARYAKNAIGSVVGDEEWERIVSDGEDFDAVVPDDASSLTGGEAAEHEDEDARIDLSKDSTPAEALADKAEDTSAKKADSEAEGK